MTDDIIRVASPERCFADDISRFCTACGRVVYCRPHGPVVDVLICIPCYMKRDPGERAKDQIVTTAGTMRELALYFAAKGRPQ